jgi:hypothetical protein
MKQIKTAAIVLFITIISASSAMAQQQRPTDPPTVPTDKQIEKMVTDLSSTLDLSKEQETDVRVLYKDHFKQVKNSKTKGPQAMEKLKSQLEKNVKSLLTKEQKKKYNSYLSKQEKERQQSRPQGRPQGGPQGGPQGSPGR